MRVIDDLFTLLTDIELLTFNAFVSDKQHFFAATIITFDIMSELFNNLGSSFSIILAVDRLRR